MSKKFKQVSTGLTLVCEREDVIAQYEKYPELYIPLDDSKKAAAPKTAAKKTDEPAADAKEQAKPEDK